MMPRILHYYTGDGLEYIFREWTAPYGMPVLRDYTLRGGGLYAGPTIFYLEDIRSNAGPIASFIRTRHYPIFGNPLFESRSDTTRGRALITSFPGHQISFGYNSLIIEAMGRTTKIKFDTIARNGAAGPHETMPFANNGGITPASLDIATYPETEKRLYKSFLGYVTEIIDPENRVTSFEYEKNTRIYRDFNFPWTNPSVGHEDIALSNYRLKAVNEPTARYTVKYYPPVTSNIVTTTVMNAANGYYAMNDVADSVYKYDNEGNALTSDHYDFVFNPGQDNATDSAHQISKDLVTGQTRSSAFIYDRFTLSANSYTSPTPGHTYYTYLKETRQDDGSVLSTRTVNTYASGPSLSGANCHSTFVILPTETKTLVNGLVKSNQYFSYKTDTVRFYGGDLSRAGQYGMSLSQKVTKTVRPDASTTVLLRDTVDYLNLKQIESSMTWLERRWDKFATNANYLQYKKGDSIQVRGRKFEDVMYSPPIAVMDTATLDGDVHIPPIFGLMKRQVIADSTGVVTGKINVYQTDILSGTDRQLRGQLLSDSIIGQGGSVTLPGNAYKYYGPLLFGTTNANGASVDFGYDFAFCHDIFAGLISCSDARPTGKRLANDNSVTDRALELSAYSYAYMKPLAEQHNLRRYDDTVALRNDSLVTFRELTYYGLVSGTRDANGWYTRFDYDANGRLNTGWMPYDFPREGTLDTVSYRGKESSELYGETIYNRREDNLHCSTTLSTAHIAQTGTKEIGTVVTSTIGDTLYASLPVTEVPVCPFCGPAPVVEKGNDRQLQDICRGDFPYNEHSGFDGFYGHLIYPINSESPIKTVVSIDSVYLELMISSMVGDCINLEVSIPDPTPGNDPKFTRTFLFHCGEIGPGGGGNDIGNRTKDARDRSLLSDGSSVTTVPGGYKMRVNLSSVASYLHGLSTGSHFDIHLKVKTIGGTVAFISGGVAEDTRPHLNVYGTYKKLSDRNDYTLNFTHNDDSLTALVSSKVDDINHTANHYALAGMHGATIRRDTSKYYFGADSRLLRSENSIVLDSNGTTRVDTSFLTYTGAGGKAMVTDPVGDSVKMQYDAAGRPMKTINQDGTYSTLSYLIGTPSSFGITDQDFYGHCTAKTGTTEHGVKHTQYYDTFDRLRREVIDSGDAGATVPALNLTTRYEYDLFGKPLRVINPKGDTTFYGYDIFNRTAVKFQPDLGAVSYAYDALGNVRFTQNQEQFVKGRLTFNEYDDLNRITLVGEASICDPGTGISYEDDGPAGGWLNGHTFGPTGIPHGSARKGDDHTLLDEIFTFNPCG
ncbi:MAG: hypothetical protein ABI876_06010, partial [Bacteroidota bacterium]